MLKASALYIVIIISLVIAVLCSALIVTAYYYKIRYQRILRFDQLNRNLGSAINILEEAEEHTFEKQKVFSLYENGTDSVSLQYLPWGVYDVAIAKAFVQKDTLYKTFSLAYKTDPAKWAALYLIDEERAFSLSGKTNIRGDAYIPKAGVQQAIVGSYTYSGGKRLITGTIHNSEKTLSALDKERLSVLEKVFQAQINSNTSLSKDSIKQSFLLPALYFNLKNEIKTIQNVKLSGNIIIRSDTTVIVDSTASFKNILVFAKAIIVKSGFQGNCQLFATDSVIVEKNCRFDFPSAIGVLRFKMMTVGLPVKISIGDHTLINGVVFNYDKNNSAVKPLITIEKNAKVSGEIYSQGILQLKDNIEVNGSLYTSRFLYNDGFTRYENFLVNTTLDQTALSPYYLTSKLLPSSKEKSKKILQWLEAN